MATVVELIDRGVRAYVQGESAAAERAWREALKLDPFSERARSYLRQVQGERPAPAPSRPEPAPPPDSSPWDAGPASGAPVVVEEGSGIEFAVVEEKSEVHALVAESSQPVPAPAPGELEAWMDAARERFALGDFSGSLELIERILRVEPGNAEARAYLRQNEATLVALYESKLGSLQRRPVLVLPPEEVLWLNLDHRAGFLLAQIDGTVSYEDLFALSGLPRLDTARILSALVAGGVIH